MLFLVRHAKAGRRSDKLAEDKRRPLNKPGWQQAEALAASLTAAGALGPVLSSPYLRCIQTVEPLAAKLGIAVAVDGRLAENKPLRAMLELINQLPDGAVLCSHGDMIPDVIQALQRRGCEITTEPNWRKGSVWVLRRGDSGEFVDAAAWPPPND